MATIGYSLSSLVKYVQDLVTSKADKSALDSHVNNKDNPHEVTAEDVSALSLNGGTCTGGIVAPTFQGRLLANGNTDSLELAPVEDNKANYISFKRLVNGVRKGYFGYGGDSSSELSMINEMPSGTMHIKTEGNLLLQGGLISAEGMVSGQVGGNGKAAFVSNSAGGSFAAMYTRFSPYHARVNYTGSSYAPNTTIEFGSEFGAGVWSTGILNGIVGGTYVIQHLLDNGSNMRLWEFVSSTGDFNSAGNIVAYSDLKLKKDLQVIDDALSKVKKLSGYTYTRKDTGIRQTGVVAQEVLAVIPEAVVQVNEDTLGVAYGNLVGLLIEAIKELEYKVSKLEGSNLV